MCLVLPEPITILISNEIYWESIGKMHFWKNLIKNNKAFFLICRAIEQALEINNITMSKKN